MVKLSHVNDWMKLIGNLGVFAGLVLVALQMQQANHIARSEQKAESTKSYQDVEVAMLGENGSSAWVKAVLDPASMTREEIKIMDAYMINALNFILRAQEREQAGLEPAGTFKSQLQNASFFFGNAFAQTWWKYEQVHHQNNPELVNNLNQAIAGFEPDHTAKWFLQMEQDLRQLPPVESGGQVP
jgi:hypothetical protein